jgi:hypothetical protein
MGSLGPASSLRGLWDKDFDHILIDLDDTLYHKPEIAARVRKNIAGDTLHAGTRAGLACACQPYVTT